MVLSGSISPAQRYQLAINAGFSAPDAVVMSAISLLECGNCDMSAVNASGDSSLWQINKIHLPSLHTSVAQLADPQESARAAYAVWKGAGGGTKGFQQWCTYPGGCGGASPISWATFNAKLAQVAQSLTEFPSGTIPLPSLPIDPGGGGGGSGGNPPGGGGGGGGGGGSGGFEPGTPDTSQNTGQINAGKIGPLPINVPTGMVIGLLGVLLLVLGVLLFAFNLKVGIPKVEVGNVAPNVG